MNEIFFNNATRIAVAGLQAAIVVAIVRRRSHRQFPFFLAYAGYSALIDTLLTVIGVDARHQPKWFHFYSSTQVIYTVLGVLAMHESFRKALRPYFLGKRWFHFLVPGVVLVILLLCGWKALRQSPAQSEYDTLLY